ncbi:MAG: hypothetical protein ABI581_11685 [Sediminibacterium sp.]
MKVTKRVIIVSIQQVAHPFIKYIKEDMIKRIAKINSENTQVNFNASTEIEYWARKYHTSPHDIQEIFKECGYSISKTIARLQQNSNAA